MSVIVLREGSLRHYLVLALLMNGASRNGREGSISPLETPDSGTPCIQ